MRVLIADDNRLIRRGIAGTLSADNDVEVCGEASNSIETLSEPTN
jgi:DNA-binding NarL/FixJ family response regulator